MKKPNLLQLTFLAFAILAVFSPGCLSAATMDLYVTASDGTILEYTPTGTGTTFAQGLDAQGRGLTFDNAGNLLVATTSFGDFGTEGAVLRIDCTGLSGTRLGTVPGNDVFMEGLARNSAGDVFVVAIDNLSPTGASTIFKFSAGSATPTVFGTTPGSTFGLAFDAAGNLFAADAADHTIYKFAPDGTRTVFASDIEGFPTDLAFDAAGNLFVSIAASDASILEFPVSGSTMIFASGLEYPRGLAFDMMGNLYVAEPAGDILKFAPDGNSAVFASGINGPQFLAFGPPSCRSVPDGGTTGALFGMAFIGLALIRRLVPS